MPQLSRKIIDTINKYKKALMTISNAGDQANPIHLKDIATKALNREITWVSPDDPGDENNHKGEIR
jgi:hypothetical protein